MRIIGFSGAHRTGKSTLQRAVVAKLVEQGLRADSLQMPTYAVQGDAVKKELTFPERLDLQFKILEAYAEVLDGPPQRWRSLDVAVFDRTPIDTLAYLTASVNRECPYDLDERVQEYAMQVKHLFKYYFDLAIFVPPGIPLQEDPTSSPCSCAYVSHISSLCELYLHRIASSGNINEWDKEWGEINRPEEVRFIPEEVLDLDARVQLCMNFINGQ